MITYSEVQDNERADWDNIASHPLQSWAWGEFRGTRQPITRIGKYFKGKLVSIWLVIWTRVPITKLLFGYIPMGGSCNDQDLENIKLICSDKKAIGIRMEPNLTSDQVDIFEKMKLVKGRNLFKPKTYYWDLSLNEEELLRRMHPKARYNIKIANKHGVSFVQDSDGIDEYVKLLFEGTVKRQKVAMHDDKYQRDMFIQLRQLGVAKLFEARYKEETISAVILYLWKDKVYYAYGANSLKNKEVMGSTFLLWEIVKWAKENNFKIFDLWGTEEGKGFSRFKQQFNAQLVEMVGTFDIVINNFLYRAFRVVEEIRWKARHI